jgi:hypothetical protein
MSTPSVKRTPAVGHPISPGEASRGAPERAAAAAGRPDLWTLEDLAERNACNERALAELRAAQHEVLRQRYEAVVEELHAFHPTSARARHA